MTPVLVGLLISFSCVGALALLFSYEQKRGVRVGEHLRARGDFFVLKIEHALHRGLTYIGSDLIPQLARYTIHAILKGTLRIVTGVESSLRKSMRINRSLAKQSERESVTRNKLEEIAIHKAENALTEEEKRLRREQSLEGT